MTDKATLQVARDLLKQINPTYKIVDAAKHTNNPKAEGYYLVIVPSLKNLPASQAYKPAELLAFLTGVAHARSFSYEALKNHPNAK